MRLKLNVKMAAIRNTQYAIRNAGQKYAIRKMLKNTQLLNTLRMAYLTLMGARETGRAVQWRSERSRCTPSTSATHGRVLDRDRRYHPQASPPVTITPGPVEQVVLDQDDRVRGMVGGWS